MHTEPTNLKWLAVHSSSTQGCAVYMALLLKRVIAFLSVASFKDVVLLLHCWQLAVGVAFVEGAGERVTGHLVEAGKAAALTL